MSSNEILDEHPGLKNYYNRYGLIPPENATLSELRDIASEHLLSSGRNNMMIAVLIFLVVMISIWIVPYLVEL